MRSHVPQIRPQHPCNWYFHMNQNIDVPLNSWLVTHIFFSIFFVTFQLTHHTIFSRPLTPRLLRTSSLPAKAVREARYTAPSETSLVGEPFV